ELGVEGQSFTMTGLIAKLGGLRDVYANVVKCEEALKLAIQDRDAAEPQTSDFLHSARDAVKAANGKNSAINIDYGITPDHEPPPLTGEQIVARAEKAAATRKARGTLGKKQKEKIKGQVPPAAPPATPPTI